MIKLERLADLLKQYDEIARQIGDLLGNAAYRGHIGEFIAEHVFERLCQK